jgi:ammonia channel protein AmtB
LRNGDCASFASRRAISVLPTPVGPIIRMFFGATSSAISAGSFCRRMRLRSAMATARFAWCCPTTYLSSSATIWRGVIDWMLEVVLSGR